MNCFKKLIFFVFLASNLAYASDFKSSGDIKWYDYFLKRGQKKWPKPEIGQRHKVLPFINGDRALTASSKMMSWYNEILKNYSNESWSLVSSGSKKTHIKEVNFENPSLRDGQQLDDLYKKIWTNTPDAIKNYLKVDGPNFPADIPVDKAVFIKWTKAYNYLYAETTRWNFEQEHMNIYMRYQQKDVRAYVYLSQLKGAKKWVEQFDQLPSQDQIVLKQSLLELCMNASKDFYKCEQSFYGSKANSNLHKFYQAYLSQGENNWDSFFEISPFFKSKEIVWEAGRAGLGYDKLIVPFLKPKDLKFAAWFKETIEEYYNFSSEMTGGAQLQLELKYELEPRENLAFISFKSNTVPYVEKGLELVMDPVILNEPDSKLVMAHEFGHILRLPDCYLNFYDVLEDKITYYELDPHNLMCAHTGQLNREIYEELKRSYLKE